MSDGPSLERRSFLRAFGAAALVRPLESALAPLASADEPLSALADFEPIPASAPGESALFLSVQHPGERHGTRFSSSAAPRGSNWPARRVGFPPQPAVVAMRPR